MMSDSNRSQSSLVTPTGPLSDRPIADRINEIDAYKEIADYFDERTEFAWSKLSFYPGFMLVTITHWYSPHATPNYFVDNGKQIMLICNVSSIYAVNEKIGLNLNVNQVPEYLSFFLEDAHSQLWLHVVQSYADLEKYCIEGREERLKQLTHNLIHPVKMNTLEPSRYHALLTAIKSDYLVELEIEVTSDGRITPTRETILANQLPIGRPLHRWESNQTLQEHLFEQQTWRPIEQ